jgi:hypothetical protein
MDDERVEYDAEDLAREQSLYSTKPPTLATRMFNRLSCEVEQSTKSVDWEHNLLQAWGEIHADPRWTVELDWLPCDVLEMVRWTISNAHHGILVTHSALGLAKYSVAGVTEPMPMPTAYRMENESISLSTFGWYKLIFYGEDAE